MNQYRTQVRFPSRDMAEHVKRLAKNEQRSMNAQIIRLIQRGLECEQKAV